MRRQSLWLLLPMAAVVGVIAFILATRPLDDLAAGAPPTEEVTIESVQLDPGVIRMAIRTDGSQPVTIAQVQVDGAYRLFTQDPPGPLGRLATAIIEVPYPWIAGEAHHITLLTGTGAAFLHTIDVAQERPTGSSTLWTLILVGLILGFAPVAAGLLSYPALRGMGPAGLQFLLALTIGLLLFLFIDTLGEGLETGAALLGRLHGNILVWVSTIATVLALLMIGRRGGKAPEGIVLAFFIAFGIGLHNLGEGLVVGAALATGAAALATFLLVGFVLHNVTEGIGIAAPMTRARPTFTHFALLAALAGLPAVLGVWVGSQAASPLFVTLSFGIGAGAILQVIIEIGALMARRGGLAAFTSLAGGGGILAGLAVMYGTALLT